MASQNKAPSAQAPTALFQRNFRLCLALSQDQGQRKETARRIPSNEGNVKNLRGTEKRSRQSVTEP